MKTTFGAKLKSMSLAKKIVLIALCAAVIAGIVVGTVLIVNNASAEKKNVTLTFYDENRSGSEQITVPVGSTLNPDILPQFSKEGHYLAAWSYVEAPTEYLKATDEMKEDTEFIAIFLKEEELFESNRYLNNVPLSCEFVVNSTVALTDENLYQYIEFETLDGIKNSIRVVDSGNGNYTLLPKIAYFPGDTYSIRIMDADIAKFVTVNGKDVSADNIRKYSFSIEDEEVYHVELNSELIDIPSSKLAGYEENIAPDGALAGRYLSAAYFDDDVALKADDIIRITRKNVREDTFHKVRSVEKVEDTASKYYGKTLAILSVPKSSEYLDDYEVKITGLDSEDIVSEDILKDDELMNIVYNELLTNKEYARAMDTLLYAAKQTPTVKSLVETLSDKERQDFSDASFKLLAATAPTIKDLNLKVESKMIKERGWVGYELAVSASPTIQLGQMATFTTSLSTSMTVKFTQYSNSFYVDDDTGKKKEEFKLINSWEYTTSSIRSVFDAETSFKIVLELTDADDANSTDLNPNVDISEQVSAILEIILADEENSTDENKAARKLLDKYLEGLDYDLINEDLDYVELFTVPLGRFTCNVYGIDITIECNFVVSAGLRCGMSSSFTYHVEKIETTKNGKQVCNGYDLEAVDWNDIVYAKVGKNVTTEEFDAASEKLKKEIKYVKVDEYKKSTVLSESVSIDFTVGGKAGLRVGVKVSLKLSGFFMDWLMYIGADVELGAYTEVTAYATYHYEDHLNGLFSRKLTGAAKFEAGFYIKFDVTWKFFWTQGSYNIVNKQWPLFTLSTTPSLYDFNKKREEMTIVARQADLKALLAEKENKSLLDLCYVDVFENSVESSPIKDEDLGKLSFRLVSYKVTDPRDNSDVSDRYMIQVSNEGFIRVLDDLWSAPRDTDVATITIYLSFPGKNFLTGYPIGKTLVVNMPLGEIIDLEHQYKIRFLDHLGNVITNSRGEEYSFTLYGNEFPSDFPRRSAAYDYLDRVYGKDTVNLKDRSVNAGEDIWKDIDGNKIKVEKATKDVDYYLDEAIKAYLIRHTYFDSVEKTFLHIDNYGILGEEIVDPDVEALGAGGKFVTGWELGSDMILRADNFKNYEVGDVAFEQTYKNTPVETSFIYEIYARYDDKHTDIVFKFGDFEFARKTMQYGTRLSENYYTQNGSIHYPTMIGFNRYSAGETLSVPSNPYKYCYRDGKLYSMKASDLNLIINDPVIKELQTVGLFADEYVIPFPATEVEYDGKVTVNLIAKPRAIYENLNQYTTLLSKTVEFGSTLTAEMLQLSNIEFHERMLSVTVSDLTLPYVINDLDDGHFHITEENGKAKITLDFYADQIQDLTSGRAVYVTLNANGGRFGTLPNGGMFAQDSDLTVPVGEMFVSPEFINTPSISYDQLIGAADYAEPVKFGSRFAGWSTTSDGKSLIDAKTVLVPKVGDAAVITLYAVFESDPIVRADLSEFGQFTYKGTVYQTAAASARKYLYLAYANGVAPELPILENDELSYVAGWAYKENHDGTPFTALPPNAPAAGTDGFIDIIPVVKNYPTISFELKDGMTFPKQDGFRFNYNQSIAWISLDDIDNLTVPSVPAFELKRFDGWQLDGGTVLNDNALKAEIRRRVANGETSVTATAVYTAHSSAFSIADDCEGTFAETPKDKYIVAIGTTFKDSGIPVPTKNEYTFVGWSVSSDNSVYALTDRIPQGYDHYSLSAVFVWNYENVIFDANGGKFADAATTATVKIKLDEPVTGAPTPTRDRYGFIGWSRTANGAPLDMSRVYCSRGLKLYAVWEDRGPRTITFNAGDGRFADGSKTKTKSISYPYNFAFDESPTYTGTAEGSWVFGYWTDANGLEAYAVDTVNDGEVFTAAYRRTGIKASFQSYVFQYNGLSGMTDIELGEVLYNGADEYGQVDQFADENGLIPYPTYSLDFTVPSGYKEMFMIFNDILSERGVSKLTDAGAKIYLDIHGLRYWSLPIPLTTDMVNIEDDYPIILQMGVVPLSGPVERVRFDKYLYADDAGCGIIFSDYDTEITYAAGADAGDYRSVPLDANGNIVIPSFTVGQQPKEGQVSIVLVCGGHLTDDGLAALTASGARVYNIGGFEAYYEVKSGMTLTRDMVKIGLQPEFVIAYVPENSTGLRGVLVERILYTEYAPNDYQADGYYSITYSGNGTVANYMYHLAYSANGELVLPEYTVYRVDDPNTVFTVEEGKKLVFLIDSQVLTDSAVAAFQASGAGAYIVTHSGFAYYEINIPLTQSMVKVGAVPKICMAYVPAD